MSLYLRRLELAGFKSFADRTRLDFEPGVSAIVGPNGSGKSNIAEAIRWVLGERAGKTLRTNSTDNLIFAGIDKRKAAASMAEVSLTLEGDDQRLIVSRKLYRSGESEYRLNGRKALARDIAKLLAEYGFGTSSYTVIGQGMVEGLIIASPAERKLLFEEASGIRAFELEKSQTLLRLKQAESQAAILRAEVLELTPERERLAGQVERLKHRKQTMLELQAMRERFIASEFADKAAELDKLHDQQKTNKQQRQNLQRRASQLAAQTAQFKHDHERAQLSQQEALKKLEQLQLERNQVSDMIAKLQVQIGVLQATQTDSTSGRQDRDKLERRLQKIRLQLKQQTKTAMGYAEKIDLHTQKITTLTKELSSLRNRLRHNQLSSHLGQALGIIKLLLQQLNSHKPVQRDQLRILLHKLIRTVKLAYDADLSAAPERIVKLQQQISREMSKREDVVERQTAEIIKQRSLELDLHALEKSLETSIQHAPTTIDRKSLQGLEAQLAQAHKKLIQLDDAQSAVRKELGEKTSARDTQAQIVLAREQEEVRQQLAQLERDDHLLIVGIETVMSQQDQLKQQAIAWHVAAPTKRTGGAQAVQREHLLQLEAELTLIGEIDEGIVEVQQELEDRVTYLEDQARDVEQAVRDIQTALAELDRRIQQTFRTNFSKINQYFGREFERLFRGGEAKIELIAVDEGQFGIEISVRPPGKRLGVLAALSGGEKTLTAIALLAAILQVNPSPFVVLDEVDAALDDANALLFCDTLKRLAQHSQLLVITHNHETMVHADRLYGVTASSRRASTVVKVDLTTAEALV